MWFGIRMRLCSRARGKKILNLTENFEYGLISPSGRTTTFRSHLIPPSGRTKFNYSIWLYNISGCTARTLDRSRPVRLVPVRSFLIKKVFPTSFGRLFDEPSVSSTLPPNIMPSSYVYETRRDAYHEWVLSRVRSFLSKRESEVTDLAIKIPQYCSSSCFRKATAAALPRPPNCLRPDPDEAARQALRETSKSVLGLRLDWQLHLDCVAAAELGQCAVRLRGAAVDEWAQMDDRSVPLAQTDAWLNEIRAMEAETGGIAPGEGDLVIAWMPEAHADASDAPQGCAIWAYEKHHSAEKKMRDRAWYLGPPQRCRAWNALAQSLMQDQIAALLPGFEARRKSAWEEEQRAAAEVEAGVAQAFVENEQYKKLVGKEMEGLRQRIKELEASQISQGRTTTRHDSVGVVPRGGASSSEGSSEVGVQAGVEVREQGVGEGRIMIRKEVIESSGEDVAGGFLGLLRLLSGLWETRAWSAVVATILFPISICQAWLGARKWGAGASRTTATASERSTEAPPRRSSSDEHEFFEQTQQQGDSSPMIPSSTASSQTSSIFSISSDTITNSVDDVFLLSPPATISLHGPHPPQGDPHSSGFLLLPGADKPFPSAGGPLLLPTTTAADSKVPPPGPPPLPLEILQLIGEFADPLGTILFNGHLYAGISKKFQCADIEVLGKKVLEIEREALGNYAYGYSADPEALLHGHELLSYDFHGYTHGGGECGPFCKKRNCESEHHMFDLPRGSDVFVRRIHKTGIVRKPPGGVPLPHVAPFVRQHLLKDKILRLHMKTMGNNGRIMDPRFSKLGPRADESVEHPANWPVDCEYAILRALGEEETQAAKLSYCQRILAPLADFFERRGLIVERRFGDTKKDPVSLSEKYFEYRLPMFAGLELPESFAEGSEEDEEEEETDEEQ